jgi:transglutaminase-like putative cysteine protease
MREISDKVSGTVRPSAADCRERSRSMNDEFQKYLTPTSIIDSHHGTVMAHAMNTIGRSEDPVERAVNIYYAVRDGIRYDPYYPFYLPEHYRASNVLKSGRGYCVCKASLLCALGRACGIPSRIGFADVRNHLATRQLIEYIGSDLFVYHGYTEFYLEGRWVKATPAFNIELCRRHKVSPLEFNGREDSIFHPYNLEKKQFMEYVADHGSYADIPVDVIVDAWERAYGKERVGSWIAQFESTGGRSLSRFEKESPV